MNYKHIYHAGNFADAFKHIVLIALINELKLKDAAFRVLDTHAGSALYALKSHEANKSAEYQSGIGQIIQAKKPPELVKQYLKIVKSFNPTNKFVNYPGSPLILASLLRAQDSLVLSELHKTEFDMLKQTMHHYPNTACHHADGYQIMKAFLPPVERRGLVLIDPPYEKNDELSSTSSMLHEAVKKWETGIFAVWYPIKMIQAIDRLMNAIKQNIARPMLRVELSVFPENTATALNGSGILIVNPPWKLAENLQTTLPWVWKTLSPEGIGRLSITPL